MRLFKLDGEAIEGSDVASIHARQRRKGVVFQVFWRDPSGQQRTKSFRKSVGYRTMIDSPLLPEPR